jgi:acyl carrier protein
MKENGMQTNEDILAQLYRILTPFVPENRKLEADTDLIADLGFDSMRVMDILAEVEDHFDISVPLNVLPDIRTIGDFALQLKHLL